MDVVLCTAEAVLADRLPKNIYNVFMSLARARRILFWPRGLSQTEVRLIEKELRTFCDWFYALMYTRLIEQHPLCTIVVAALLYVMPSLRACGPE